MVKKSRVYLRVAQTWLHTIVAFAVMAIVLGVLATVVVDATRSRAIIGGLLLCLGLALVTFLLSEVLVTAISRAYRPSRADYPNFFQAMEKLWPHRWHRPRMYILNLGIPNAAAFGIGIFAQAGIGITPELYELLDTEELTAVIAHETGHVRSYDTGIMSVLSILTGGIEVLAKNISRQGAALPLAGFISVALTVFSRVVFPVGRNAISQERELSADALAALYTGSVFPLQRALIKLEETRREPRSAGPLDGLLITHPHTDVRINELDLLVSEER